jgi:phospholipase C
MISTAVAALAAAAACSGGGSGDPRTQTEAELAPMRAACTFATGATATDTIGTDFRIGRDIPIKHVVVIVQENRSFDTYLGRLVAQGYYKDGEVDVPPANWSMSDGNGGTAAWQPDDLYCYGVDHSWAAMHDNWDGGKNDRFVINNNPDGRRAIFYQDDKVIPFYYALASKFAIGDRYFASVMGPTWPNRYFMMSATSFGYTDNSFDEADTIENPAPVIFQALEKAGHTWKDYTDGPHMIQFYPSWGFNNKVLGHNDDVKCGLMNDIDNDKLPDVAFIMGNETSETSDEGPSALPGIGGLMVETIIRRLWASPAWKDTVVFITYDENGGIADHVPPQPACMPDGTAPHDGNNKPEPFAFDHTGFRVPFIVVSPYARPHFVSHTVYDHTSITRFIEARFGLPALTARDANAIPPFEMFDFDHPAFMTPPTIDVHTSVPDAVLTQCKQTYAPFACDF